jgi:hypothetical protein
MLSPIGLKRDEVAFNAFLGIIYIDMSLKIKTPPDDELESFEDYQDFVTFTETLFKLQPSEYRGLYKVLQKLQSLGEDPKEVLHTWKQKTCQDECPDFIRFMIEVDNMDIKDFNLSDIDE